jgi:hypothetical protein
VTIVVVVGSSTTGTLTNSASVSGAEADPDTTSTVSSAAAIPALSQWGLIAMAGVMASLLLWYRRRGGRMANGRRTSAA